MRLFKRKPKSTQLDPTRSAEASGYLQGHTDGYAKGFAAGEQQGFDDGVTEGYNKGRAEALDEFKRAAEKALTKGES